MLTENWPIFVLLAYLWWDWTHKDPRIDRLERELADARAAYGAALREHEEIHASFHRYLLNSPGPENVRLRHRIEETQGRIGRARSLLE